MINRESPKFDIRKVNEVHTKSSELNELEKKAEISFEDLTFCLALREINRHISSDIANSSKNPEGKIVEGSIPYLVKNEAGIVQINTPDNWLVENPAERQRIRFGIQVNVLNQLAVDTNVTSPEELMSKVLQPAIETFFVKSEKNIRPLEIVRHNKDYRAVQAACNYLGIKDKSKEVVDGISVRRNIDT